MKNYDDMTFAELVDDFTSYSLSRFVEDGGKGLKSAMHAAMSTAIEWKAAQKEKTDAKVQEG